MSIFIPLFIRIIIYFLGKIVVFNKT